MKKIHFIIATLILAWINILGFWTYNFFGYFTLIPLIAGVVGSSWFILEQHYKNIFLYIYLIFAFCMFLWTYFGEWRYFGGMVDKGGYFYNFGVHLSALAPLFTGLVILFGKIKIKNNVSK